MWCSLVCGKMLLLARKMLTHGFLVLATRDAKMVVVTWTWLLNESGNVEKNRPLIAMTTRKSWQSSPSVKEPVFHFHIAVVRLSTDLHVFLRILLSQHHFFFCSLSNKRKKKRRHKVTQSRRRENQNNKPSKFAPSISLQLIQVRIQIFSFLKAENSWLWKSKGRWSNHPIVSRL